MSETVNIMKMAEKASDEIFSVFGWEKLPAMNQKTECVDKKKHGRMQAKIHPTDAVWKYLDPYLGYDIYVYSDLKSYAKGTLDNADLAAILRDIARGTECANKSEDWKRIYVDQKRTHQVIGLLFIYNHDGGYEKEFSDVLAALAPSSCDVAPSDYIGVVGPERVIYL